MSDKPQLVEEKADEDSVRRGYETTDFNPLLLLVLLVSLVLLAGGLGGGLWWFYGHEARHAMNDERPSAVNDRPPMAGPPLQPQLGHEVLDAWDLRKMREQEDQTFEKLGWARDERRHHFAVPAAIVAQLQQRQAASRPAGGGG